jgi:predicted O-linked N-acetylglucosamine transferase (SPINDLY family)
MLNWLKRKIANQAQGAATPVANLDVKRQGDEHVRAARYAEAERCYRQVPPSDAQYPASLIGLGFVLREQARTEEAREVLERAVHVAPGDADGHYLLAIVLEGVGPSDAQISHLERAVALRPDFELARRQLITAQQSLSRLWFDTEQLSKAELSYRREIELTPEHFGPYHQLGLVLHRMARHAEAIVLFERAISLNPHSVASYSSLAAAYTDSEDGSGECSALARANFERAVLVDPENSDLHFNLGVSYWRAADLDRAKASLAKAIDLNPDNAKARWASVMLWAPAFSANGGPNLADRSAFGGALAEFEDWWSKSAIDGADFVGDLQPFFLAYQEENNLTLLKQYGRVCAMAMQRWLEGQPPPVFRRPAQKRVRVGIVSADVRVHSVWMALIKGWFQSFDPERFELVVFSLADRADSETDLARAKAAVFFGGPKTLSQWVTKIREQNCELLLYPAVGLDPMTLKLASLRLAPIQINSWGHPDTSGLPTLDYFVSAECFEPAAAQDHYAEQLVLLPRLGNRIQSMMQPGNDPEFSGIDIDFEKPIVICPGTPFKYQPADDHVLSEIARRVPSAQIIFFRASGAALATGAALTDLLQLRLTREFESAGLDVADHVRFIRWLNFQEFHHLLRKADVMLDTIGFSGFNTAVQAIECGLPIVTREGRFLRGRLASGVLRSMDLTELIVETKPDYVSLAVRLLTDRNYRVHIRHEIQRRRSVLFDDQSTMASFQDFLESVARPALQNPSSLNDGWSSGRRPSGHR